MCHTDVEGRCRAGSTPSLAAALKRVTSIVELTLVAGTWMSQGAEELAQSLASCSTWESHPYP